MRDESRDLEAARAAGLAFGAVTWGYTSADALRTLEPDAVFEAMAMIADFVLPSAVHRVSAENPSAPA